MYNECDKHQRSLHSRFINPPATEYNSTHLLATQASSRLPVSQQLHVTLKRLGPVPDPYDPSSHLSTSVT